MPHPPPQSRVPPPPIALRFLGMLFTVTLTPAQGALFQTSTDSSAALRWGWFLAGSYILLGLVCGAACAYGAIGRNRPPAPWFVTGLFLNIVALALLYFRGKDGPGDPGAHQHAVPRGLAKVPTTRPPRICSGCGSSTHPAASRCQGCGNSLRPTAEAESSRV